MDDVDTLIASLLEDCDLESDFGRTRAYRLCVRYAEQHLSDDHRCNLLLVRAAELLGQQPMALPVVENRVPLDLTSKLYVDQDDDEGITIIGNPQALRYLGRLCLELADAPVPGESVTLYEGEPPCYSDSYGLTLFCEDERWFELAGTDRQLELAADWELGLAGRIVRTEQVVAIQFTGQPPNELAVSAHRIYRVAVLDAPSPEAVAVNAPDAPDVRWQTFELYDDDDQLVQVTLDLDDPAVQFYYPWHLAQLTGV